MTSEASSSSCYYNNNNNGNGTKSSTKRSAKIHSNDHDIEIDVRQQLSLNVVGGYVDDLMERIRKMPPKKRSKFYQMLDEERLKDVNNNHPDHPTKSKVHEGDEDDPDHRMSMDVSMPLVVNEVPSDEDDDRTLIELTPNSSTVHPDEQLTDKFKEQFLGLNEKNFEELRSMGVPPAILKALIFQHEQTPSPNDQLTKKRSASSSHVAIDPKNFLNARTILRQILQQHQKEQQRQQQQQQRLTNDKPLVESMDYSTDEEGGMIEDDHDEHRSSIATPRHRNGVRSNSHNPVTVTLHNNDISSLSPPTSTSASPEEADVNHQSSPNSLSRPSSTPAALISSTCSF